VKSLRQYERPASAYTKVGGMGQGMRRTASTTLLDLSRQKTEQIKKKDFLTESQLTFDWKYQQEQKQLASQ